MKSNYILIGFASLAIILSGGCVKKEDTIAKIEVRDESNQLVEQAILSDGAMVATSD